MALLAVDTGIPYGNATDIAIGEEDGVPVVSFVADPHGGPESMWFCFRLLHLGASGQRPRRVKLALKHLRNMLGGGDPQHIRPVLKPPAGDWERIGPGGLEEHADGRRQAAWLIDGPDPFVDIALCYPYGRPEIDQLLKDTGGYWQSATIGISQAAPANPAAAGRA